MVVHDAERLRLLPQQRGEFASKSYWDSFFSTLRAGGASRPFEWYGSWADLRAPALLEGADALRALPALVVGCGNSTLSADLHADGFRNVTSIDFSEGVVEEMRAKYPALEWQVMDMLALPREWSGRFGTVFDKGSLDALVADDAPETLARGRRMLDEVTRALAPGGVYLCVSLLQEHILELLLRHMEGFRIHVRAFEPAQGSLLLPFLLGVSRGGAARAGAPGWRVFRAGASAADAGTECAPGAVSGLVVELRTMYHMQQKVKSMGQGLMGKFALEGESSGAGVGASGPRYVVSVVDSGVAVAKARVRCAVFLVPQGREHEWGFSSEEGLAKVATSNLISRLIVVAMGRGHAFDSLPAVQAELSPAMLPLAAAAVTGASEPIPFMTVSNDLGERQVRAKLSSELSGDMSVEEVVVEDGLSDKPVLHRRLFFLSNQGSVQSEARLLPPGDPAAAARGKQAKGKSKGKSKPKRGGGGAKAAASSSDAASAAVESSDEDLPLAHQHQHRHQHQHQQQPPVPPHESSKPRAAVDKRFLAFEFHQAMVSGLFLLPSASASAGAGTAVPRMLVVGLGGGALASYLASECPWLLSAQAAAQGGQNGRPRGGASVESVELDPAVVETARRWFDFDDRLVKVHVGDGAAFLERERAAPERFRAVFVDVDAKDLSQPVMFPPMLFLQEALLERVRDHVLEPEGGLLVLNLASKSVAMQRQLLQRLAKLFPRLLAVPMSSFGDLNCVVFAVTGSALAQPKDMAAAARRRARAAAQRHNGGRPCAAFPHDFADMLDGLRVVSPDGELVAA
jgi:SAM-dependent methyltransferase